MKIKFLLGVFLTSFLIGCSHSDQDSNNDSQQNSFQKDVYIAGKENGNPCYWKNNVKVDLIRPSDAATVKVAKIIVDNDDVYVLGDYNSIATIGRVEYVLWKNNQLIDLRNYFNYSAGTVFSVLDFEIYNHKLYFCTREQSNFGNHLNFKLSTWGNNQETFLVSYEDFGNQIEDLEVNSNGVYVTANYFISGQFTTGYFHNTTFHDLSNDFKKVNEIEIQGNTIYAFGNYYDIPAIPPYPLYKNLNTGVKTTFSSYKYNLRLDNNDVYVTDEYSSDPKIYKNGNSILSLHLPHNGSNISDFKVSNGSTYVITKADPNNNASLFINGINTFSVNSNNSEFNSVCVVNH